TFMTISSTFSSSHLPSISSPSFCSRILSTLSIHGLHMFVATFLFIFSSLFTPFSSFFCHITTFSIMFMATFTMSFFFFFFFSFFFFFFLFFFFFFFLFFFLFFLLFLGYLPPVFFFFLFFFLFS